MKINECYWRTTKSWKHKMPIENYENYGNHVFWHRFTKIIKNLKLRVNQRDNEIHKIIYKKMKIMKIIKFHWIITKIMKILVFLQRIMKILKILKFHVRSMKNFKIIEFHINYENHENHRILLEYHAKN